MQNNYFTDNNIFFENDYIDLLKKRISAFVNQAIQIITLPEFETQADAIYSELKRDFQVTISYIPRNMCYSLAGINTLWCSQRENVRLLIAVGDEHTHNATKLLSQKTQLPYCFLSFDFANIYSLNKNGILLSGEMQQNAGTCIFKNYNLEKIDMNTCACSVSQAFSLSLLPFENYIYSKLENYNLNAKENYTILKEIERLLNASKNLALGSLKAKFDALQSILKLSSTISQKDFKNELFITAQKYVYQNALDVEMLHIYSFITFQILIKVIKQYFDADLISPLSLTFSSIIKTQYNKDNVKRLLQQDTNLETKLKYIFYANHKFLTCWLTKLDSLQHSFTIAVKNLFPDCGFGAFSQINYAHFLSFIKMDLINEPSQFMSKLNLVAII